MEIDSVEALGFVAGLFGTFASLPQLIKVIRTRSAKDVSLEMFVMAGIGAVLWGVYGWMKELPSIVLWNGVAALLIGANISCKLIFSRKGE
jgi:MtN3 and saliva related transmembrane protein